MKKTETSSTVSRSVTHPSTQAMLLRHDKTEAEDRFTVEFLLFLKREGYSGEIHCRCFLVNQHGEIRRPDFYLPRYGLAIEIDGATRHSWASRNNDLEDRDKFYFDLGAQPVLILNSIDVVSEFKMDRFKREFLGLLHNNRMTPKQRSLIKKRISEGRTRLEERRTGIFDSHGTLAPQFLTELALGGFKEIRHFGGTKFILRSKYKTNPFANLKIDPFSVVKGIYKQMKDRGDIDNKKYLALLREFRSSTVR